MCCLLRSHRAQWLMIGLLIVSVSACSAAQLAPAPPIEVTRVVPVTRIVAPTIVEVTRLVQAPPMEVTRLVEAPPIVEVTRLVIVQAPSIVAGPTAVPASTNDLFSQIKARGMMRVSTDPNYKPQSFLNETTKELDGFDIDVSKEVAKRLGVKVEFVTPDWDTIIAGNWGGRWDVSIGSMTITPIARRFCSSRTPYYYTPAQFAVPKDSTLTSVDELAGKTVCVGSGTTYEDYLNGKLSLEGEKIIKQVSGVKVQTFSTDAECIQAFQAGRKEFRGRADSSSRRSRTPSRAACRSRSWAARCTMKTWPRRWTRKSPTAIALSRP